MRNSIFLMNLNNFCCKKNSLEGCTYITIDGDVWYSLLS